MNIRTSAKGKRTYFFKEQEDQTLNTILYCITAG